MIKAWWRGVLLWVLLLALPLESRAQNITTGLVAWWRLQDASGVAPVDSSGNGNTATLAGGTFNPVATAGCPGTLAGTCLEFDGDARVSTPVTAAWTDFTACVWFHASSATGNARILDKTYDTGFWIGYSGAGTSWGGGVQNTSAPYGTFVPGFPLNTWHHLCSKREGMTHTLYGNRGAITTTATVATTALSTDVLWIGGIVGGSGFVGKLAHVRLYSRALTPADMQAVYDDVSPFVAPAGKRRLLLY